MTALNFFCFADHSIFLLSGDFFFGSPAACVAIFVGFLVRLPGPFRRTGGATPGGGFFAGFNVYPPLTGDFRSPTAVFAFSDAESAAFPPSSSSEVML